MKLNVSEVQDFMRCRYRWWAKWVKNRVPRVTATPLTVGKLIHSIFEDHLRSGVPMGDSIAKHRAEFRQSIEAEQNPILSERGREAQAIIDGLDEALRQWKDDYRMDHPIVEVEEPFSYFMPLLDVEWVGRPDRVSIHEGKIWHNQIKNLAAGVNFAVYLDLQQRSYHEHLYAEALAKKYSEGFGEYGPGELKYGGTMFTLVRKLKYRTGVTKSNPEGKVKPLSEMFWQAPMAIDLDSELHRDVMDSLKWYACEMYRARNRYEMLGEVPPPNEMMNGGAFGNSPDEYFRVLTGDAELSDDTLFMDREDTYTNNKEEHNAEEASS